MTTYHRVQIEWDYISKFEKDDLFWLFGEWHQNREYTAYKTVALRVREKDLDRFLELLERDIRPEYIYTETVNYVGKNASIWKRW